MNDCFTVKSFCKALYLGVFFFVALLLRLGSLYWKWFDKKKSCY